MVSDYLEKQWKKIEYSTRVISIKNLAKQLSFIYNKDFWDILIETKNFFVNKNDALFVNDNQVIDKKMLYSREIFDAEKLIRIINNEYFISDVDLNFVSSYFYEKNHNLPADKRFYISNLPDNEKTEKRYISYPEDLFEKFYLSTNRWEIIKYSYREKAKLLRKYLDRQDKPQNMYDIYFDLSGALFYMSVNEIIEILNKDRSFINLCGGYWTTISKEKSVGCEILVSQLLLKDISKKSLDELLKAYIKKTEYIGKYISIEKIIKDFKILGIEISNIRMEELLLNINYLEIYPNYWTKNKWEIPSLRFNLTERWNETCNKVLAGTKNERDKEVFYQRIFGNKTLEQIGNEIGVTRERVRQIEKRIRNKMKHQSNSALIKPFCNWTRDKLILEKIMDLKTLDIFKEEYQIFDFVINEYLEDKEVYRLIDNIIIYKPEYDRLVEEISRLCIDKKIVSIADIPFSAGFTDNIELYNRVFTEVLGMVRLDDKNYFYSGRKCTKEEELYIIIYKAGKPLHFSEIQKQAEILKLPLSTSPGRNILATMQRNNLLKRVAPGTYGLKEWNIPKHIYITDLIYKVLRDADRPMFYGELFAEIKRNRIDEIKEKSVQYYLAYHEEVIYIYTKQYILLDWIDEPEKLAKHGIDIDRIKDNTLLHSNKVILDVLKRGNGYITKYKLSEASIKTSSIRISRYVEFNFDRRIAIIDRYNNFNFNSYSSDVITGINRWSYIPNINEEFYIEFINEKVARFLTAKEFENYKSIEEDLLVEAEKFWENQMNQLLENEEKDEDIIDEISTVEALIRFGLDNGYVYYETIEKLVDQGYNPRELLYELNDRDIIVNY